MSEPVNHDAALERLTNRPPAQREQLADLAELLAVLRAICREQALELQRLRSAVDARHPTESDLVQVLQSQLRARHYQLEPDESPAVTFRRYLMVTDEWRAEIQQLRAFLSDVPDVDAIIQSAASHESPIQVAIRWMNAAVLRVGSSRSQRQNRESQDA
jgi:hypothetical protein